MIFTRRILWVLLLLLLSSSTLFGQATASSAIRGTVMDKTGAVVVGAEVTVTSLATNASRTGTTGDDGTYRFDGLSAGTYKLAVSKAGFSVATVDKIAILLGTTTSQNITMVPGAASQIVEVTSAAPLVDQVKTEVSQNVLPDEVEKLPTISRDFASLAALAPGATLVDSYDPTKNRIAIFGINGSSGRNVNLTVNGIDNKDNTVGGPVMQLPLEAIQEFQISTQRFSAANGRSEGAAVNVITRQGTNRVHGAAYAFFRDTALNANDAISEKAGSATPPYERQQFGGRIGLPLIKDRTAVFFALERYREHTSLPVDGDSFAQLTLAAPLGAVPARVIPTPYFDWRYNGRLDHRFNDRNNVYLSYSSQSNNGQNDQSTGQNDLTAGNFTTNELQIANLTWSSVISPRVVNQFTFGYQYWNNLIDTANKTRTITFPGGISLGTNVNVPQQSYQQKWQFKDDFSVQRGKHGMKMGLDYLWEPKLGGFFEFNPVPEFDFFDKPNVILGCPAVSASCPRAYPQGFATPGAVSGMTATSGNPRFDLPGGAKMFGLYFQDEWQATSRLTLNLGLRWDKDFNLIGGGAQGQSRTFLLLKAINHPAAASLPHDDNLDFSPRIGFAYDLTGGGKHVLRGGYGIYYGQTFLNIPLFMIQQQNPTLFVTAFSIASTGPGAGCTGDTVPGTAISLCNWRFGVDPNPTIPPPPTNLLPGNTGRIMDPNYRNPYSQQWNFGYAWSLNTNSVVEVEYVHELALHESKTININPTLTSLGGARPLSAAFAAAGQPVIGRVDLEQAAGRSWYDGLNFVYRQRMWKHFSINTNYVLSRAQAYKGNPGAFRNRPTCPIVGIPACNSSGPLRSQDLGDAPNDERHRFTFSGIVELPWGFSFSPIIRAASARPYDCIMGRDVYGIGGGRGNISCVVDVSAPTNLTAHANDGASTQRACLIAGTCKELNYNSLRGDRFFQFDARVTKAFKFGESRQLDLIGQFFNLTNRANFGSNFDGNVRNASFRTPVGYFNPSSTVIPRAFGAEFGARFSF